MACCPHSAADKPLQSATVVQKSSTTSGAFFAESLSQTMGTQMNPGAMLQTSIKSPSARTSTQPPGSPMNRMASSRLSVRGPADSPLPATSPRRLARADGRSGTVVIWGEGWNRSASPIKSSGESPAPGAVSPYAKGILTMSGAVDTVMHPLVSESEDLSATPRPEAVNKSIGFEKPKQDQEFVGHKMLNVCGGFGKLALITQDGGVVQSDGESNEESGSGQRAMPVPDCGSIRQVVAGQKHTLFLDEDGFLYAGGHNTFGQLGFPGEASVPLPRQVPAFAQRPVAAVACGQQHSMALTDWGDVYAWGRGSEGQLGCGRFETIPVPRYVHGLKGKFVDAISCGYNTSMAVTQQGELYVWGDDTTGQLGLGPKAGRQASPRAVTLDPNVEGAGAPGATFAVGAAGGWGHTCAVTSGGVVWSWGFGGRGQLGLGDFTTRATPSIVKGELLGVHVRQVTCGAQFSVALSTDGKVYVWGSGSHYRLGLGDNKDRCLPTLATIKGKDVTQLAVTEDRLMAFAPARISKLIPDSGPLSGGTRINIEGDGFFEAPRIKVSLDMSAAVSELDEDQGGVVGVYGRDTLRGVSAVSQVLIYLRIYLHAYIIIPAYLQIYRRAC
jgi:alpha-tubulin suppressor-like RCC1 family protein